MAAIRRCQQACYRVYVDPRGRRAVHGRLEKDRAVDPVILEKAILNIRSGQSQAFEAAFRQALPLIAGAPGFISLEVRPCIETPDRYLLLARWQTVEDHMEGFRRSSAYPEWRTLLHHFYEPFPTVEHYGEPVASAIPTV